MMSKQQGYVQVIRLTGRDKGEVYAVAWVSMPSMVAAEDDSAERLESPALLCNRVQSRLNRNLPYICDYIRLPDLAMTQAKALAYCQSISEL